MRMFSNEDLALNWYWIKPKVDEALAYGMGDVTAHDLFLECMAGIGQCWEDGTAIAISRIVTYTRYKELVIVTTTGEGWYDYGPKCLDFLEKFAQDIGCKYVSIYGRKGWGRVLPEGYVTPYQVYMKEI